MQLSPNIRAALVRKVQEGSLTKIAQGWALTPETIEAINPPASGETGPTWHDNLLNFGRKVYHKGQDLLSDIGARAVDKSSAGKEVQNLVGEVNGRVQEFDQVMAPVKGISKFLSEYKTPLMAGGGILLGGLLLSNLFGGGKKKKPYNQAGYLPPPYNYPLPLQPMIPRAFEKPE